MNARESSAPGRDPDSGHSASEPTAVLPETAAQLVEMERLQLALVASEERARNHGGRPR